MPECKCTCADSRGLVWIHDREKEEERENYTCFGKTADPTNTARGHPVDCCGNRPIGHEGQDSGPTACPGEGVRHFSILCARYNVLFFVN